jgi:hypothetical protein
MADWQRVSRQHWEAIGNGESAVFDRGRMNSTYHWNKKKLMPAIT